MATAETLAPVATEETVTSVGLFDLTRQRDRLGARIEARIDDVLRHGQFILGPEVVELEEKLAAFAEARHAIGVSSGRDALTMALMALGVQPGDAVFVPGFTFSASAAAVAPLGAVPVFVDVDEDTFNMDPDALKAAIAAVIAEGRLNPKVVMPVDLYGLPADYDRISAIAAESGMRVLADAAQSFGAIMGNRRVGTLAPITATSFYPTKPLGCYGDGGAILTEDEELSEAIKMIRTHGRQGSGDEAMRIGMTARLDTIQAAVLLIKLEAFAAELDRREQMAALYTELLAGDFATPVVPAGMRSAWALYTIRVPNRDQVRERLAQMGVGTGLFYRVPLHKHPAFEQWAPDGLSLPVSERLAEEVLSLPIHGDIEAREVRFVVDCLRKAVG
ncbi:DegT/DnrJ/EryC1/StrS family aminotransferase [Microbaculum sp. FT89]|uniref:DegT/DnrJ/EryC1/StrS family aminotransferase n=1 Tax=Microbaculum sp. FT89 TaxID=3447298 RepID=UPI003F534B72